MILGLSSQNDMCCPKILQSSGHKMTYLVPQNEIFKEIESRLWIRIMISSDAQKTSLEPQNDNLETHIMTAIRRGDP